VRLPPADPAVTSHFFPEALLSLTYSGEFRQVVNLFISLPTVRTEAQLAIFMQTLFELQDRYGGMLNKLDFGDKGSNLLLFWGAPVAYENDIERALDFILALQPLTSIPINAGVTYQIAHAGFIGSPLFEEYTCYGKGINLAARFMTSAPRGEIWIDEQVARRASPHFELDFEGELSFKGFAEKQRVYVLRERKEVEESFFPGSLVGRQADLSQLTEFAQPLWQNRFAGALVVRGEAGIGKSRLVHEFWSSLSPEEHPATWALCQADATLRSSLNPFRYWLRRYFGQSGLVTESRNKRSFNQKLDVLIEAIKVQDALLSEELDRTRSFLGALVDLYWPDSLFEQLDPQGRYENTWLALTALLQAESLRQPVLLFLEDAHWLDEDSRAYIPRLVRALTADENRSYPIAIIATVRPEAPEALLGQGLPYREIPLAGISIDELSRLAEQHLEGSPSPQLLRLLADRAEGNPFFAEQVLRYLQEEGLLEASPLGWQVRGGGAQSTLPADVRAVLVARLDRLGQEVKDVVQTASILGREFELQLLVRMLRNDERLYQRMAVASRASIWSALNELRYVFQHALVHDAAYRTLLRAHRQALHALAVDALEGLYAGELSLRYDELAYHSERADLQQKARHYLELAGDAARHAYRNSQAVEDYSAALALTPPEDLEARYKLLLGREAVYDLLGEKDLRRQDLIELSELAETLDHRSEGPGKGYKQAIVWERWATYSNHTGEYAEAALAAEKAVLAAGAAGALDVAMRADLTWSFASWRQGKYDAAIRQAEAGLELARQMGDRSEQSRALNLLGLIMLEQKGSASVRDYLEGSLRLARETGNRRVEISSLNNLGILAANLGDYLEVKDYYEQGLRLAREIGDRMGEGRLLGNLGWVTGLLGDYAMARSYCEQNLRITREAGDRHSEAYTLINLSSYSGRLGDIPAALSYAELGLSIARQAGDPSGEAWAQLSIGNALLEMNQWKAAASAYQAALEIRRSLNQPNLATEPQAGLARLALLQGDWPSARLHAASIHAHLSAGGTMDGTDEPLRVYLTCYRVFQQGGDRRAAGMLETAYNLLQERAAKINDASMRSIFLEKVPYHREILAAWNDRLTPNPPEDLPA
jgi:predicted ATPase